MVNRQKIETNIAHNVVCSLAPTDFNNHLIFAIVDGEKNGFTLTAVVKKKSHAVYQ